MRSTKKSTAFTLLALLVSIISLGSCFTVLGVSNSVHGVSVEEKKEWDVKIDGLSNIAMDVDAIGVLKEPVLDKFKMNYGVRLVRAASTAQFEFLIKNEGDFDAEVTDIKVTGIENYTNFVDVSFVDLAVGDVISKESFVAVKVITNYHTQMSDMYLNPQEIFLDNINIEINLQKIE